MSEFGGQRSAKGEAASRPRWSWRQPLHIRTINAIAIVVAAILSLVSLVSIQRVLETQIETENANKQYTLCSNAARDLQEASDYLTTQVRMFVTTEDRTYLDAYLQELLVTDRRGIAVETLKTSLGEEGAVAELEQALGFSNDLAARELYAMRLVCDALGDEDLPPLLAEVSVDAADEALAADDKVARASELVLGDEYRETKEQIGSSVNGCLDSLINLLSARRTRVEDELHRRLGQMQVFNLLLLGIVVISIFSTIFLILWPLASYTRQIKAGEPLTLTGASELRYLADAYNVIFEENRIRTMHLKQEAERDSLTGLLNRRSFDALMGEHEHDMALMLIDVDYFKQVNDTYGHDMGDAVLKKVATLIEHSFRTSDFCFRVGGDEFAVIMTDTPPNLRNVVESKIRAVSEALHETSDGLPDVTLSVGVAFSGAHEGEDDIFRAADRALYVTKEGGRNGLSFYGEEKAW